MNAEEIFIGYLHGLVDQISKYKKIRAFIFIQKILEITCHKYCSVTFLRNIIVIKKNKHKQGVFVKHECPRKGNFFFFPENRDLDIVS